MTTPQFRTLLVCAAIAISIGFAGHGEASSQITGANASGFPAPPVWTPDASYSAGSLVTCLGSTFKATTTLAGVNQGPASAGGESFWTPIMVSSHLPGAIFGTHPAYAATDCANLYVMDEPGTTSTLEVLNGSTLTDAGAYPIANADGGNVEVVGNIVVDGQGNVYFADIEANVWKVARDGGVQAVNTLDAGEQGRGVAWDNSGNLWVAGYNNGSVYEFNSSLAPVGFFNSLLDGGVTKEPLNPCYDIQDNQMCFPRQLGVDFVCLYPDGGQAGDYGADGGLPYDCTIDSSDQLWGSVAASTTINQVNGSVVKYSIDAGTLTGTYATGGAPRRVTFDGEYVYVANEGDGTVTKLYDVNGLPALQNLVISGSKVLDLISTAAASIGINYGAASAQAGARYLLPYGNQPQLFPGNSGGNQLSASALGYLSFGGTAQQTAAFRATMGFNFPNGGVCNNFTEVLGTTTGASKTFSFLILNAGGTPTPIVCNITNGTTCSDGADRYVLVANNDGLVDEYIPDGGPSATYAYHSIDCYPY